MRVALAVLLVSISLSVAAQKPPEKFGDISMEDMTMKVYPLDSSASAVVLFDYGLSYASRDIHGFTVSITWHFERHTRIKVLKKEGLNSANIGTILSQSQSIEELKAATYNLEEGKILGTDVSKENIFNQNLSGRLSTFSLALPGVKEGSIIEIFYKFKSSFNSSWSFQNNIPVRLSEYWLMVPDYFSFERKMQGFIPLDIYDEKKTNYYRQNVSAYHFGCKNIPAFKVEPFSSSPEDYISKISFNFSGINSTLGTGRGMNVDLMGSWSTLNDRLMADENFGRAIEESEFLRDEADRATANASATEQKISAMINYVKNNYEWNGRKTYFPNSLKNIREKKSGTSADLNILLAAMLAKVGLNVDMVLLSTRDHGMVIKTSPIPSQFNYAICLVTTPEKVYYLDATEKYLPYDVLPTRCLNVAGLRISKSGPSWMDISSKAKEKTSIVAEMKLTDAGSLQGKINYVFDGYDAATFRKDFFAKGKDELVNQVKANTHWTILKSEIKDAELNEKSAQAIYEVEISEHANATGDVIYVNPFVSARIESNPFVSATRLYPIDFPSKIEKVYSCKIVIPPGYTVEEAPQSKLLSMPQNGARFNFNVAQLGDAINITSIFQINKTQFQVTEYELLREFYNQVVAKQAEQIVFKKK